MTVAFDIDHTVWIPGDYNDPSVPINGFKSKVVQELIHHANNGSFQGFVTGRPAYQEIGVRNQLAKIGFGNAKMCLLPDHLEPTDENLIRHKSKCMREWGVKKYYGDMNSDRIACQIVGAEFIDATKM